MCPNLQDSGPRRILSLSGGGVRGIVEVAFLEEVDLAVKKRYGPDASIADVFHLIGGTSTGALIATALSLGLPLSTIKDFYLTRATRFFGRRRWWAWGQAPVYDGAQLEAEIRQIIGDVKLGDPEFQSFVALVTKRLDTGSAWIVSNIPTSPYFEDPPHGGYVGNRHYEMARLLKAATAAPVYFEQTPVHVGTDQLATFVDGGLSPYNDPSLALLKLARLRAFGLEWPVGIDNLHVLSIGTGRFRQRIDPRTAARMGPVRLAFLSMLGMAGDAEEQALTMMQWLGHSVLPQRVNSEIGDLAQDTLAPEPLFRYLRLDLPLEQEALSNLGISPEIKDIRRLQRMDDPEVILPLYDITKAFIAQGPDIGTLIFGADKGGGSS
ncbi:MAG: patatin-like phospholipase family protein [Pseudomonadota bacterium]